MPYNIKKLESCLNDLYGVHSDDHNVVYYIHPLNKKPHVWKAEFIDGIYYRSSSYKRLSHLIADNELNMTQFLAYMEDHINLTEFEISKHIEL